MATISDIETRISETASDGVSSASFSQGSSSHTALSIDEQIKAHRFLSEIAAKAKNHGGLMFRQIQPPGARNDS